LASIEELQANDHGRDSEKYKKAMAAILSDAPTLLDKLLAEFADEDAPRCR
jgi:hypothetical protein